MPTPLAAASAASNPKEADMSMHYAIRLVAGTFVLGSLALGYWVNPLWYLFTAFVGLNLIQSAFTHWCLMERILSRLGLVHPA
jgi:H+/gluconate symporter-like permease